MLNLDLFVTLVYGETKSEYFFYVQVGNKKVKLAGPDQFAGNIGCIILILDVGWKIASLIF